MTTPTQRITLKNIKHAAFASEETYCYSATVYFDGYRCGTVKNDGRGGCDYQYAENEGWPKMMDYIDTLPKLDSGYPDHENPGNSWMMPQSLETICHDLVTDFLIAKDLKSLLRRCFVWQRADGEVRQCKRRKEHTVDGMESVIAKTEPTAKLLNAMSFDDALDIYKAI